MRERTGAWQLFRSLGKMCGRPGPRRWLSFSLALMLFAVAIAAAPAQGAPPPGVRVSLVADTPELTVGDIVTLSLIISHPEHSTAVIPRLEREWGLFEVQAQTSVQTVSQGDGIRTVAKQFRVTLFAPGTFETPELPVSIRGPDGTVAEMSPVPVQLTVNPVLTSADDELKDLRPPADLSTPFWEQPIVLVLIAIVALAVAGGTAFFLYRRSRRTEEPLKVTPDTRTPREIAIQELERIGHLGLPARGEMKEHYTLVAAVLREYIGAIYPEYGGGRNADDMSTEEIAAGILQSDLDYANAKLVVELLQEADLVKFANDTPTAARANEVLVQARNVVEATRPGVTGPRRAAPAGIGASP